MCKLLKFPSILLIIILQLYLQQNSIQCIQFNRNVTGVTFSAYVRSVMNGEDYKHQDWKRYTLDDIKTMLKVISGKFSKVATFGVGSYELSVGYHENQTYYHQSYAEVYSAEAAAILNQEGNTPLTMLLGVWLSREPKQMSTELQVALESARKANAIYPHTVQGLVFSENGISTNIFQAKVALAELQKVKEIASQENLKLGTRQQCNDINELVRGTSFDPLIKARREIVMRSDFIICIIDGSQYDFSFGAPITFERVGRDLVQIREMLQLINPQIEVMVQTGFSTAGSSVRVLANMRNYWELVDKWATQNNFSTWMHEAFDNPWKDLDQARNRDPWAAHYGWWKLKKNQQVGEVEGYIEKVSVLPSSVRTPRRKDSLADDDTGTGTSVWTYIGIVIGLVLVIIAIGVMGQLVMLRMRFNKIQHLLTKDEVKHFMYGDSEEATKKALGYKDENGPIETIALSKPYDKSFEISKSHLKIAWESRLGEGAFGCVYKACLSSPSKGDIEVALKMTKDNCPKTALKSLLSEIKILIYLGDHPNLVSIKGAYTAEIQSGVVYVATEFCNWGSLKDYMRNGQEVSPRIRYQSNEPDITFYEMIRWSYEIACGMEYLTQKHVIHADLAARNVLLTFDKIAKITDFGLSRRLYDYTNYVKKQQEPLPWRWMAIESLKKLEFNSKTDVWSYGVTLWEIFSMCDVPYPGLSWTLDFVARLENGLRMNSPTHASPEIYKLLSCCWEREPLDRPTFSQLKKSISRIRKNHRM